ncbi:unnamed protein product, partial [Didymodactylos carnosus]
VAAEHVGDTAITGFCTLESKNNWYLFLENSTSKEKLLDVGALTVKGQNLLVSDACSLTRIIHLHGVPPPISDETLKAVASRWGEIVN